MKKIVLLEDNLWFADQQQRVLSGAGYRVAHAMSPYDGMELIEQLQPDALIIDMLLRDNTAMVLLNELQSCEETARLPIILYTAQATVAPQESFAQYGVVAVLDKTTMQPGDTVQALRRVGL